MNDLDRDVAGVAHAHQQLLADLDTVTAEQVRKPSRLPDWTMAHVLAHIAGNADGCTRMIEGACRGEVADQYEGGFEGRQRDIDARASLSAAELVDLVRRTIWRLETAWALCSADGWLGSGVSLMGVVPVDDLPFRRWRETVIHHADLGLAYTWRDWPNDYVRIELQRQTMSWASRKPMGLTQLPAAAMAVDDHHRLAWLVGRADIDGLGQAGMFA